MVKRIVLDDPLSRAALWSRRVALFALVVAVLVIGLARSGRIEAGALLATALATALLTVLALLLACLAFIRIWQDGHRGIGIAGRAFILAAALMAYPAYLVVSTLGLPRINDISTDLNDPPSFSRSRAAIAARDGHIPIDQAPQTRALQRAGYPGLVPILVERSPDDAFEAVKEAARLLRWQVIEAIPAGGRSTIARLDAIDRTMLLRFADDITIRVRPVATGARVDIRSVSRIGRFDFGANAVRIAQFSAMLNQVIEAR
jgi:uncharacterized protein (DUF1499 family)